MPELEIGRKTEGWNPEFAVLDRNKRFKKKDM
jgi:hypothetical protein